MQHKNPSMRTLYRRNVHHPVKICRCSSPFDSRGSSLHSRRIKHHGPSQSHCTYYTFWLFLHRDHTLLAFIHSFFSCSLSSCSQATWKPPPCGSFLPTLCIPRTVLLFLLGIGFSSEDEVFQVTSGCLGRYALGFGTGHSCQLEFPAGYLIDG